MRKQGREDLSIERHDMFATVAACSDGVTAKTRRAEGIRMVNSSGALALPIRRNYRDLSESRHCFKAEQRVYDKLRFDSDYRRTVVEHARSISNLMASQSKALRLLLWVPMKGHLAAAACRRIDKQVQVDQLPTRLGMLVQIPVRLRVWR